MSVWQEDETQWQQRFVASMTDVHFKISCQSLPIDHAQALADAVAQRVPWLADLQQAGVHPVHVAASQNGWQRPDLESDSELALSRRTRLKIRIDSEHAERLMTALSGQLLLIAGYNMQVISGQLHDIKPSATLFSRYTCFSCQQASDEAGFVNAVVKWCELRGHQPTKIVCGKDQNVATSQGKRVTRSVMLADVPTVQSVKLQETGIGDARLIGCGIVIPHKDTAAVIGDISR